MDNKGPLVSVVIPTYNRPELVIRAVNSVLDQTYKNIEVLVVDDASDKDIENALPYSDQVKYLRNKINSGPCYSRNHGLKEAKGDFINFLDDDDEFFPEKIKKQINCFQDTSDLNLGMVTCHAIDERSGRKITKINHVKGNIYKELLASYIVSGIETMLFRKSIIDEIGGFDENLESSQEYDLLIRFSEKYNVDYVDEILCKEYRSFGQINVNFDKKISGAKKLYQKNDIRFKNEGLLFWLKMKLKLRGLLFRFYVGKIFGEKMYRLLISDR